MGWQTSMRNYLDEIDFIRMLHNSDEEETQRFIVRNAEKDAHFEILKLVYYHEWKWRRKVE